MNTYVSTCTPGTSEIVKKIISEQINAQFVLELDGYLMYESDATPSEVKQIRGLYDSLYVLESHRDLGENGLTTMLHSACRTPDLVNSLNKFYYKRKVTLRVRCVSVEGEAVFEKRDVDTFEKKLLSSNTKVRINRRLPDNEVWFLLNKEGFGCVGVRLTMTKKIASEDMGADYLPPEFAHILCFLSDPNLADVVLDPFAGKGAIVLARTNFKSKEILAIDNVKSLVSALEKKIKEQDRKVVARKGDGISLFGIADSSIDKIITDPILRLVEVEEAGLVKFYTKMLKEFVRLLNDKGSVVLVCDHREIIERIANEKRDELLIVYSSDVIIGPRTCCVFKLEKVTSVKQ
ncbi:MAG: hypothetical protein M3P33_02695 [bacterium]|nr:hypothetical protein [bacterium]